MICKNVNLLVNIIYFDHSITSNLRYTSFYSVRAAVIVPNKNGKMYTIIAETIISIVTKFTTFLFFENKFSEKKIKQIKTNSGGRLSVRKHLVCNILPPFRPLTYQFIANNCGPFSADNYLPILKIDWSLFYNYFVLFHWI